MRPEDIWAARNRQPFVPFYLVFTDGRRIEVPQPDYLFVSRHVLDIGVAPDPRTGLPAQTIMASPLHVVRIEYPQPVERDT